ncbi:MAG: glycosyltransferase family 39 protein [Chloroflexi bacterium]|nr:glycosyltransferase family 39 protein [Chloroflexota bacterium]
MLGLLALAVGIRISHLLRLSVIENEGAEYATIALNLGHGLGYVGLHGTPQMVFPPLYPLSILALSTFTGDITLAGRLVSLLAGSLLIIVTYMLAKRWYGPRIGLIAAALITFSPFMIAASTVVLADTLYTALALSGVYPIWLAIEGGDYWRFALAGATFGLAHLAKPDAMIYSACLLLVSALCAKHSLRQRCLGILIFIVTFALLIIPYVTYLHTYIGQWLLEGKSGINAFIAQRQAQGMGHREATVGLDREGQPAGPLLQPNQNVGKLSLVTMLISQPETFLKNIRRNLKPLYKGLFEYTFGPLVLGLAHLLKNWSNWRRDIYLGVAISIPVGLVAILYVYARFFIVIAPLLSILAALGIWATINWLGHYTSRFASWVRPSATVLLLAAAFLPQWPILLGSQAEFQESFRTELKNAGLWLHDHASTGQRVMSDDTRVPFYAGKTWVTLPVGPNDSVLAYAEREQVDYLVVPVSSEISKYLLTPAQNPPERVTRWQMVYVEHSQPGHDLLIFHRIRGNS